MKYNAIRISLRTCVKAVCRKALMDEQADCASYKRSLLKILIFTIIICQFYSVFISVYIYTYEFLQKFEIKNSRCQSRGVGDCQPEKKNKNLK